ncbi:hypothetical protein VNO78_21098 [Psophocarpus tetragonolobus]|uniref:Uncharacterized protein n=1 Tax=Psophocarpus tetragonolobus TaxID=3891 RepID=A0AAN9SC53_PSOTE
MAGSLPHCLGTSFIFGLEGGNEREGEKLVEVRRPEPTIKYLEKTNHIWLGKLSIQKMGGKTKPKTKHNIHMAIVNFPFGSSLLTYKAERE